MTKKIGCPVGYVKIQGRCVKKMKKPQYSSIKWDKGPRGILSTDPEHIIAKGSYDAWGMGGYNLPFKECSVKKTEKIRIGREDVIKKYDARVMQIGNSCYDKEYLYRIMEEIRGEKILLKSGVPIKKMIGKTIALNTRQRPQKDLPIGEGGLHDEIYPIVIEGNNGFYMIAPRFCD